MSRKLPDASDPRIQAALAELQQLIVASYPGTVFDVFDGEDPCGVYLRATVDRDDLSDVVDAVLDKLYELQVEQGLPVYVVTTQTAARVRAHLAARVRAR